MRASVSHGGGGGPSSASRAASESEQPESSSHGIVLFSRRSSGRVFSLLSVKTIDGIPSLTIFFYLETIAAINSCTSTRWVSGLSSNRPCWSFDSTACGIFRLVVNLVAEQRIIFYFHCKLINGNKSILQFAQKLETLVWNTPGRPWHSWSTPRASGRDSVATHLIGLNTRVLGVLALRKAAELCGSGGSADKNAAGY